jgi:hypothetical protein
MDSRATLAWDTTVSANYRMFGFHDPTCEESENFATAVAAASRDVVGWAANAAMVEVTTDLVRMQVQVEVFDDAPAMDDFADLLRDGQLEIPGGVFSIPYSVDETFQRGVELPAGPGTYGVRVCGYGRTRARQLRETGVGSAGPEDVDAVAEELQGVERYRICLWQVSPEPRWDDDDEE